MELIYFIGHNKNDLQCVFYDDDDEIYLVIKDGEHQQFNEWDFNEYMTKLEKFIVDSEEKRNGSFLLWKREYRYNIENKEKR